MDISLLLLNQELKFTHALNQELVQKNTVLAGRFHLIFSCI